MGTTVGVVYVAIGGHAPREAELSVKSLKRHNPNLPVTVIDEFVNPGKGARWAKLNIDRLVDYDRVLYLDADTRVHGDVSDGFKLLDDWDMAIAISDHQENMVFAHIGINEREQTIQELCYRPVQLQAGVMFFDRRRCAGLFEIWRQEWQRWQDQDQAALIRALNKYPVRVWLLSKAWNSIDGQVIEHLFGRAR